ncbi:MAG: DUF1223 domain-containing protein [Pseudomonadota bacterium]|nr:DUF1223 domain-containing protein [Pseudomonadota bacterium]
MRRLPFLAALPLVATAALAEPPRPVVVELFTSQSCSSCPPADALLGALKRARPDVLVLDFHVDYWDRLGWKDPYSSPEATQRQRQYAAALGAEVYTPQLVVDGRRQVVGSDQAAVLAAVEARREELDRAPSPPLRLEQRAGKIVLSVGAGQGSGTLWLVGYDDEHTTQVGGGENGGRRLTEVNVVRSLQDLGAWHGVPVRVEVQPSAGQRGAALLQAEDGRIVAAAELAPTG